MEPLNQMRTFLNVAILKGNIYVKVLGKK